MQFTLSAALVLALSATTLANPFMKEHKAKSNVHTFCDESTYTKETTDASPLVTDCLRLAMNVDAAKVVGGTGHGGKNATTLYKYGSCSFGARAEDGKSLEIGNADVQGWIIDAVGDADKGWGWKGKMGGKGETHCAMKGDGKKRKAVAWAIYHS